MTIKHLTEANFENELAASKQPVLVDFYADWCGPCKALGPVLDELAAAYQGRVEIAKVNVDHAQNLANKLGIRGVPTLIVFKGGQEINRMVGGRSRAELAGYLDGIA